MTASQESLKLDESFTSLAKHKYSVSFGALSVADEGIDDLEESFNLKFLKNQVLSENFIKKVDPV